MLAFLRQTCLTYVCTQILLLPLTLVSSSICIRALEAPGLYYDACMTYFICRVVLWYLPVSPWSWLYIFACMISVRLNRGRHKLVSEPTACRNPLPHSLAEVESSHYKTFNKMDVWLTGPRRHWVVLGSFTSHLYSGTLISLLFGLNDFANNKTNFRFSRVLSPGEPLRSGWSPAAPEDFEVTLRYSFETLCPLLLQFPTIEISLWINTYTCRSYFHSQLLLLLQDASKYTPTF